nr:phospholipase A2 inhibitor and Ly6/PLAUR domain-containing protein-like [Zootoca vivipara]
MKTFLSTCLLLVILGPGLDTLEVSTSYASQEVPAVEAKQEVVMAADTAAAQKTLTCPVTTEYGTSKDNCLIEGGGCFSQRIETYLNGSIKTYTKRGCAEDCISANATFSSVEYKYLLHIYYCCQFSYCNLNFPKKPRRVFNGLECPNYCVAESAVSEGSDAIKCYNEETQCIDFVLVDDDSEVPDKVVKGCASPAFCELAKTTKLNKYFSGTITRARCGEALPSPNKLSIEV